MHTVERISRLSLATLSGEERDFATWPKVDLTLLSGENRSIFEKRSTAICAYLKGVRLAEVEQTTGIDRFEVNRLVHRCLALNVRDGRIFGFRALIPGVRVVRYLRTSTTVTPSKKGGKAGLLTRFFDCHPDIKTKVIDHFLLRRADVNESHGSIQSSHRLFVRLCRKEEIGGEEYPFNTKYFGERGLGKYLTSVAKRHHLEQHVSANFGKEACRLLATGNGLQTPRLIFHVFQRVLFDGHRIDGIFVVKVSNPNGEAMVLVLDRPWLLLIIDALTRVVLGWHLCLNPEYNQHDVLKCVRSAVEPWKRRDLTTARLEYPESAAMPSERFPELQWAVWSELSYDNANANLAESVRTQITSTIGGAVNAGPAGVPERRGIIEAFFRTLEMHFHRLPNTTGSSPKDPRRKAPEKAAKKFELGLDHLLDLLHVVISTYNAESHSALEYSSPLERLGYFMRQEQLLVRRVEEEKRANLGLLNMRIQCTVRGNTKKGRRPYIQYAGARYTSEVLARQPDLIGTTLDVVVDTENMCTVQAFLPNGAELGLLVALGRWSQTPHGIATRKAANSRRIRKLHQQLDHVDPVHAVLDTLRDDVGRDKRALGKYVTIAQEAGLPPDFKPRESGENEKKVSPAAIHEPPHETLSAPRRVIIY